MPNKLITALKENKNDIRKKVVIVGSIVAATVVAGVVLSKLADQEKLVLVLEEASENVADAAE